MRSCSSQSSCEAGCGGWPGVDENASWCPPRGGQHEFGGLNVTLTSAPFLEQPISFAPYRVPMGRYYSHLRDE